MLNWIKAFGLSLVIVAGLAGVVAVFVAVTKLYGPDIFLGLLVLILVGSITWALHDNAL